MSFDPILAALYAHSGRHRQQQAPAGPAGLALRRVYCPLVKMRSWAALAGLAVWRPFGIVLLHGAGGVSLLVLDRG